MRIPRTVALVGLVALAALSGCTVTYLPPEGGVPASAHEGERSSSSPDAVESAPSPVASPARSGSTPAADLREEYGAAAQETGCDGGEVTVAQAGVVLSIEDACDLVRIEASGTVVLGSRIGTLEIVGAANQVQATSIRELRLGGSGNDVRWDTGTPETTDTGAANTARSATQG